MYIAVDNVHSIIYYKSNSYISRRQRKMTHLVVDVPASLDHFVINEDLQS